MKFGKTYSEFIEKEASVQLAGCSYVKFKKLKKVLKKCTMHDAAVTTADDDMVDVKTSTVSSSTSSISRSGDSRGLKAKSSILTKKNKQRKGSPTCLVTSGVCPTSCPGTLDLVKAPFESTYTQYFCQYFIEGCMLDIHILIDSDAQIILHDL